MKYNRDILKAFIHSLITLVLLYVLLNANISFMNDILKFIVAIYLLVVFMFHITFIFARCLNLRTLFKGRIGNGAIIFEETYVKLGFAIFLLPLILIVESLIPESYD
jgi:hypothetical protein